MHVLYILKKNTTAFLKGWIFFFKQTTLKAHAAYLQQRDPCNPAAPTPGQAPARPTATPGSRRPSRPRPALPANTRRPSRPPARPDTAQRGKKKNNPLPLHRHSLLYPNCTTLGLDGDIMPH